MSRGESFMLKQLKIHKYRKLENMTIELSPGMNIISGTNGTCKTSLLHLVSNSFQAPHKKCQWVKNPSSIDALNRMNDMVNPKVETLTKGDKQYKDPAPNFQGALYSAIYTNGKKLSFRRHNSKGTRYSVKPYYKPGKKDSLPFCPVIYLGLKRLYPFGQFMDEEHLKNTRNYLPADNIQQMDSVYKRLTGMEVSQPTPQAVGSIKRRSDFKTQFEGVDANTISDGEDNLYIILTALECLKFYTENIGDANYKEGILLIDEFDATLHPSQQINLLRYIENYSIKYHIQVILTTHSLSTIEEALKNKFRVFYLIDNENRVVLMENPDIYKIRMYLYEKTQDDIFENKNIPIFTEDEEARTILTMLLDYYRDAEEGFRPARGYFHFVDAKLGSDNLRSIFKDEYLLQTTLGAICVLDGDQMADINHNIICLPGNASPEKFLIEYSQKLYDEDSLFWNKKTVLNAGYSKVYYRDHIKANVEQIEDEITALAENGQSTHSIRRKEFKKLFTKEKNFFSMIFKFWLNQSENRNAIERFYKDLYSMFRKVAQRCGINPNLWTLDSH